MTYLNCSRCGLSIPEPRVPLLAPEYCPRCIARRRGATPMFRSPLTMRQLAGEDDTSFIAASGPEE
jgi:hypothetical protein